MKFKKLAIAAAVAVSSSGVWADNINVTDIDLASGSAFFGAMHFDVGDFTDTFTFKNAPPMSNGTASLITIALPDGTKNIDFAGAKINALDFTAPSVPGVFEFSATAFSNLSAPLMITVTGTASGVGSGNAASYSGTLNVSPVPEPETYALMLAGLGAIGFMARRRRGS